MGAHYPWAREIDEYVVLRSRIVVDEMQQGLREHGEILILMERGRLTKREIDGDLGGLAAGTVDGRQPDDLEAIPIRGHRRGRCGCRSAVRAGERERRGDRVPV